MISTSIWIRFLWRLLLDQRKHFDVQEKYYWQDSPNDFSVLVRSQSNQSLALKWQRMAHQTTQICVSWRASSPQGFQFQSWRTISSPGQTPMKRLGLDYDSLGNNITLASLRLSSGVYHQAAK